MGDERKVEEITISDGRIFSLRKESDRVFLKRDALLPKLAALLNETIDVIFADLTDEIFVDSTFKKRPEPRSDTLNPKDQGEQDVHYGFAPKKLTQEQKLRKPDGSPAFYGYFALVFKLTGDGLRATLQATRPEEVQLLMDVLRSDPEICAEHMDAYNQFFLSNYDKIHGMTSLEVIKQGLPRFNPEGHNLQITTGDFPYPISLEQQGLCSEEFCTLLPFYLAMVDRFLGREDRLLEYITKVDHFLEKRHADDDSEPEFDEQDSEETDDDDTESPDDVSDVAKSDHQRAIHIPTEVERERGRLGELYALQYERNRLIKANRADLAALIVHVSADEGDGAGYDIRSFEEDGRILFIEVKTTNGPKSTPFVLTSNELRCSEAHPDKYRLFRIYDFEIEPRHILIEGPLRGKCELAPIAYRATLAE